jgi:D-alanyl-D-alanine carboxypeptidase/D-alanyl-D-alanine-endopeptidase (penicillin-binding protein 4)
VKRVTGDLVADATYFVSLPNGSGWTADDLNDYYGAEISALTLEENYAEVKVTPATTEGQPATLTLVHPHTGLVLDNRTKTVAKDRPTRLEPQRIFGENVVHIFGEVPVGATVQNIDVTVPRPAQWFAGALKEALARAGIQVEGNARSLRWPDAPAVNAKSVKLGEVVSPPLRDLIKALMKPSQNLETDLIFAHVGESLRTVDTPAARTSEQLALAALREFFRKNNLPVEEVRFDEGSGLSRNNLTTANATLALLKFMSGHRAGPDFFNALPIAGVDGTLRKRMKETPAQGNVRAKTGTLRWAAALSGHVTSAAGEHLIFSLMLNRSVQPQGRPASAELDEIAVMLARFSGRTTAAATETSAGSR